MAAARQYEIKVSMTEVATTMRTRFDGELFCAPVAMLNRGNRMSAGYSVTSVLSAGVSFMTRSMTVVTSTMAEPARPATNMNSSTRISNVIAGFMALVIVKETPRLRSRQLVFAARQPRANQECMA